MRIDRERAAGTTDATSPNATTSGPATTSFPTARRRPPCKQYQNTFAISVAGRGFDARISTEFANPLPDSACVYRFGFQHVNPKPRLDET